MRPPDLSGTITRDSPGLAWLGVAEGLMGAVERAGLPVLPAEQAGLLELPQPPFEVKAWKVRNRPEVIAAHEREWGNPPAPVGQWLVNGPFHPFWRWWYIAAVHLRSVDGIPAARKHYPEAEYELVVRSLNPDPAPGRGGPDIDLLEAGDLKRGMPGFLSPPDLVHQFHGVTDEQAERILDLVAKTIVDGMASPDTDFAGWWRGSIDNTVRHYRNGVHQ